MAQLNGVEAVVANGVNGKAAKEKVSGSKDLQQPKPSLSLDTPFQGKSTPPFPSPSSSFLPPPDFTVPSLQMKPKMNGANGVNGNAPQTSPAKVFIPPPPLSPHVPQQQQQQEQEQLASPPSTPKPQRASGHGSADGLASPITPQAHALPSHARTLSLSSSRRAPPSPSMSRRTSEASKRFSTASAASSRHRSSLSQPAIMASAVSPSSLSKKPGAIKIKDFGYPTSDDRHIGKGRDVPKPNRQNSRLSVASEASSTSSSRSGDNSRRNSGWGGFKWGSNAGSRFSWFSFGSGARSSGTQSKAEDDEASRPSRSDFERNFDISSPTEENARNGAAHAYLDDEDAYSSEEYSDADGAATDLRPGQYRALYAFAPEGDSEMALEEGQIVHVVGRGGGVGWAVVLREGPSAEDLPEDEKHALVPESYLELVNEDDED